MKLSIVTPNYNYGRFLQRALDSVVEQLSAFSLQPSALSLQPSPFSLEHIVVDGASSDDSVAILEAHRGRVSTLPRKVQNVYSFRYISEKDAGQTDAINKGLRMATGDLVAWLNADEFYNPGGIAKIAAAAARYPQHGLFYGEPVFTDADCKPIRVWRAHVFSPFVLLWRGCYISSCCTFWRREILERLGYPDPSYKAVMDGEYWVRLMKNGVRFKFVPATIASFIWHDTNVSAVFAERRVAESRQIKLKYGWNPFRKDPARIAYLRVMMFLAHQYRRLLVLARLIFIKTN